MVIKELKMKNFGKFTYKDIELRDGINIVYGNNESGKSTVHSFIRGMLFGLEKKRGRASKDNLYERYKPWEGNTLFSGYMKVEDNGEVYDLSRVFTQEEKKIECVKESNGEDCVIDDKPSFLADITENKYRNTISNEQTKVRVDKDLASELKNYIANLSTSKDREVDVSTALTDLNHRKREVLKKTTAKDIEELSKQVERDATEEKKLSQLIKELDKSNKELVNETKTKEEESIRIIRQYVEEYDGIKAEYAALKELEYEKRMLSDIDEKVDSSSKAVADKIFSFGIIGVVSFAILIILITMGINTTSIILSAGVLAIGLFTTYFFNDKVTSMLVKKECERNIQQEKGAREEKDRINNLISEKQNTILEYARRVCPLNNIDDDEMLKLDKEVSILKNQIEGHILQKERQDDEMKLAIEKLNWQINLLESDSESREDRKKNLEELKLLLNKEKNEVDALNIAIDTIDELSKTIHLSVSGDLNNLISKYCEQLTEGKYSKVRVGDQFDISVYGNDRYIDIDRLSVGTVEQVYLAVRLAVSEMFWNDRHLPILLDESFAFYDKDRLRVTLRALSKMDNRQVIIFTCNTREATILEEEDIEYNYVEL